jgi:ATP-binding cassette, subfamily B, bacterial MsbA
LHKEQHSALQIINRLISNHIKPYIKTLLLAVFFMIIVATSTAAIVKLVEPAINQIFLSHDRKMLIILPLVAIVIYGIKGLAEYYQSYLIKYVGQRILTDLQIRMYQHLLHADVLFVQSQSSGKLISRFTNDVSLMRGAVSNLLVGCAKHLLSVLFLIGLMFKLEPALSCIVFLVFPLAIYPVQRLGRKMRGILGESQEELSNYTARLDETFHSIKIVKSFSGEEVEAERAHKVIKNILNFYKKAAKLDAIVSPIMEVLSGLAIGFIIWYGGLLVIEGKTTPGALFAFMTAFVSAYRPFKSLVLLNVNLQEGLAAAKRVFHLLDIQPTIHDAQGATDIEITEADIVFDNIELRFGKKVALKLIDLKINHGKTTAIVGRSGSGKTSLINLLMRFFDATNGQVLINGVNIKNFTINSLRKQISYVPQDTILFDTTVAENIAYGKTTIDLQTIIQAAKLADADEFIAQLPEHYDTMIGAYGATLSGGQRQRLSIARAFLKNAPILVFDEATSALDLNSERLILESLKKFRAGKTNLIITHRLSSITDSDEIIVMKAGKIVERGTHAALIGKKSEYYKLYNKELEEIEH